MAGCAISRRHAPAPMPNKIQCAAYNVVKIIHVIMNFKAGKNGDIHHHCKNSYGTDFSVTTSQVGQSDIAKVLKQLTVEDVKRSVGDLGLDEQGIKVLAHLKAAHLVLHCNTSHAARTGYSSKLSTQSCHVNFNEALPTHCPDQSICAQSQCSCRPQAGIRAQRQRSNRPRACVYPRHQRKASVLRVSRVAGHKQASVLSASAVAGISQRSSRRSSSRPQAGVCARHQCRSSSRPQAGACQCSIVVVAVAAQGRALKCQHTPGLRHT
eukprot:scaffold49070_cov20-Tisochrysis_lutea.AAC.2